MAWERHNPKTAQTPESYAQHKVRTARRGADLSASGRDIGELPRVEAIERRAKAAVNFQYFCEAYFPQSFHLAWSDDHRKVLRKIEQAVLHGGLFAMAMPRGSGRLQFKGFSEELEKLVAAYKIDDPTADTIRKGDGVGLNIKVSRWCRWNTQLSF